MHMIIFTCISPAGLTAEPKVRTVVIPQGEATDSFRQGAGSVNKGVRENPPEPKDVTKMKTLFFHVRCTLTSGNWGAKADVAVELLKMLAVSLHVPSVALSVESLGLAKPDVDIKFKLRAFGSDDEAEAVLARLSNTKKINAVLGKAFSAHASGKRTW